jgi:hypothetical protein
MKINFFDVIVIFNYPWKAANKSIMNYRMHAARILEFDVQAFFLMENRFIEYVLSFSQQSFY